MFNTNKDVNDIVDYMHAKSFLFALFIIPYIR